MRGFWRGVVIAILVLCAVWLFSLLRPKERVVIESFRDTIIIRDTIEVVIEKPVHVYLSRVDTVLLNTLPHPTDSDPTASLVEIPIERKEYRTDDYYALIEGYRAELLELTLFPEIQYITTTERRTITKRSGWGLGVQVGYGFSRSGISPYVGVGLSYNILSW